MHTHVVAESMFGDARTVDVGIANGLPAHLTAEVVAAGRGPVIARRACLLLPDNVQPPVRQAWSWLPRVGRCVANEESDDGDGITRSHCASERS